MNKAVFLDRDGTINEDYGYVHSKTDFSFLPGVIFALKILQKEGFLLIIITNQSGIARGFFTETEYCELNAWMLDRLKNNGVEIAGTYFCPHHPNGVIEYYRKQCSCRKPKTDLFYRAVQDFDIDLDHSYAIGNQERDVEICKDSNVKGYVVYSKEEKICKNIVYIKGGLLEAANCILKEKEKDEEKYKKNN